MLRQHSQIALTCRSRTSATRKHKQLLDYYFEHPEEIEEGFKSLFKEFGVGKGRVDLVGIDKNKNLCLVEIKTSDKTWQNPEKQIARYRNQLKQLLYYMRVNRSVRAIASTPSRRIDLGASSVKHEGYITKSHKGIPTSREIYGLKVNKEPIVTIIDDKTKKELIS